MALLFPKGRVVNKGLVSPLDVVLDDDDGEEANSGGDFGMDSEWE